MQVATPSTTPRPANRHRRGSRDRRHADRHDRRAEPPAFAPRRVRATARA